MALPEAIPGGMARQQRDRGSQRRAVVAEQRMLPRVGLEERVEREAPFVMQVGEVVGLMVVLLVLRAVEARAEILEQEAPPLM